MLSSSSGSPKRKRVTFVPLPLDGFRPLDLECKGILAHFEIFDLLF